MADQRLIGAIIAGNKPLVATEAGYHNDLSFTGPHRAASERATAIYTPRLVLEAFLGGIQRTYVYQLLDPYTPAQAQARGIPPSENSFGLLRWNHSPKPSFFALRNPVKAKKAALQAEAGQEEGVGPRGDPAASDPKAGRRAASRALRRGGRVSAPVTVTARSATGAKLGTARTRIVLRRRLF